MEELYEECESSYFKIVDECDSDGDKMNSCIENMLKLNNMLRYSDLISANETLDDIPTRALSYFNVDFYLSHLYCMVQDRQSRLKHLTLAKNGMINYLEKCIRCEIIKSSNSTANISSSGSSDISTVDEVGNFNINIEIIENFLLQIEEGVFHANPKPPSRDEKIAQYKSEKARKNKIQIIQNKLISLKEILKDEYNDSSEVEELRRTLNILKIYQYISSSMTELKLIEQELDIINNMDDVLENDVNHNSSDDNAGIPPPSKGIEIQTINKVDGELVIDRSTVKASVFQPRLPPPTMTLAEFADEELRRAKERSEREANSEPTTRRYNQLVKDGDEDNIDLVDAATIADREWDLWKEDHPKGMGNKLGKRF